MITEDTASILSLLDGTADQFTMPMMDNGYVYLAATRLSLFRSESAWALVIERFGFSPRAGAPNTEVFAVGSGIYNRKQPSDFHAGWYPQYLRNNPSNEQRFVYPIDGDAWQDQDDITLVHPDAIELSLRGKAVALPDHHEYARRGIMLESAPRVQVFELCRYLAQVERERVLATPEERRFNVDPALTQILQLEEWHHPDLARLEPPSGSNTFRALAEVIVTGDVTRYAPTEPPNTHWSNWPDGGLL